MMRVSAALVVFCVLGLAVAEFSCPSVYDGLTNGKFDLASQFSVSEMSANWNGLSSKEVLGYEWAVVSEDKLNTARQSDEACRLNQGFAGVPDVLRWTDVKKDTSATATGLRLEAGQTYFVILRTTLSNGVYVFSQSNGIFIIPEGLNLEGSHKQSAQHSEHLEELTEEKRYLDMGFGLECPIDEANRCTRAGIAVREILSELYGPPRFLADPVFALAAVADDDDDDDDDGGTLVYLPIVVAALVAAILLLLCCLLLAALIAAFGSKDGGSQKFTENVTTSHTDHVDADFGTTTEHKIQDDTRVEFPDYDPSTRLSVA